MDVRARLGAMLAIASVVVGAAVPVGAGEARDVVRVSGPSPYAACNTPAIPGEVVVNHAEVEPRVATNPDDHSNLIGVWQQDRWSQGGAHGLAAAYSIDTGRTWHETTLPFSRCARGGLAYDRASDPWVSIGPDGTAYVAALSLSNGFGSSAVAVATSTDGGRSWKNLRTIQTDASGANDKESVTADPTRPGTAYVVWDRQGAAPAGHFSIPTMFSKTSDGGRTWSTPRAIATAEVDHASIGNVILVDPRTHALYDFYGLSFCTCSTVPKLQFVKSTNGGATWSPPHDVDTLDSMGVKDPNTPDILRTADFDADVALDPESGALHAVWQTPRFNGGHFDEIAITSSTDGGRTWTKARRANTPTGHPAFTPSVAVGQEGVVAVTYYDLRRLGPNEKATLPTDYWMRTSRDGGKTFSADQHIAGSFNMKAAPQSEGRGFFVGDYQGLTSVGRQFLPFFVQSNCASGTCPGNPTDVFAAQLAPLPASVPEANVEGEGQTGARTGEIRRPAPSR